MDFPQLPPTFVMVEEASTRAPTIFIGFMGVGEEAALRALEAAAKNAGFLSGRTSNHQDETEVMIIFPPGSDSGAAFALYREAASGRLGKLTLEVTIAPAAAMSDGRLDTEEEVSVEPPSKILIPNR